MSTYQPHEIRQTWRPGMTGIEARSHERLDVVVDVSFSSDHNFFTGFSQNISEGGLFVATYRSFPVGARVAVSFTLPGDDRTIEAVAEVRWVKELRDGDGVCRGLGMRFVEMEPQDVLRVQHFIESQREPLFHEE